MSRSGYSDDCDDQWGLICYRGAVESALRGKRGQAFLRELIAGLDAMPEKRLIADALEADGQFCALGVVGAARGTAMKGIDPEDAQQVGAAFNIAEAMAREIVWINDECNPHGWVQVNGKWEKQEETPEERWQRVRTWAERRRIEWEVEP